MNDIRISPGVQRAAIGVTLALAGLAVAAQYPEIQRYLKVKAM